MKSYLIAGASSGIGAEVATQLSNEDNCVILVSRRKEQLEELSKRTKGKSIIIPADLTSEEDIQKVYETIEQDNIKLSGMVYTAGICFSKTIKTVTMQDLENMFRINLFGFHEMCKGFYSTKHSEKGSSIVGISSYAARSCETGMSTYSMTKEAMNVLVKIMAKEYSKRRIRVNTVMPAVVKSKMAETNEWTDEELANIQKKQTFGVIPIEQVVECVKFLLSDKAYYITGENMEISADYHG